MRHAILAILSTTALASAGAAQRGAAPAPVDAQSIRIGKAVVARPFGADLVDRLYVVGSYRLGKQRAYLVRGDTANSRCPSRFVFVNEQPGAAPSVSTPFGTCSAVVRVRQSGNALVATMPASVYGGDAMAEFAFDGTTLRPRDPAAAPAESQCLPSARVDTVDQANAIDTFEEDYPLEFRSRSAAGKVAIDAAELRSLVGALACLAPWPAAERRVPAMATPLFASRHGPAAFASLAAIADDPASGPHLRAAARSFAAEMIYRVERSRDIL